MDTKETIAALDNAPSYILQAAFSEDGNWIYALGYLDNGMNGEYLQIDYAVRMWNIETGDLVVLLESDEYRPINRIALDANGTFLATGIGWETLLLPVGESYSIDAKAVSLQPDPEVYYTHALAFDPTDSRLLSADYDTSGFGIDRPERWNGYFGSFRVNPACSIQSRREHDSL